MTNLEPRDWAQSEINPQTARGGSSERSIDTAKGKWLYVRAGASAKLEGPYAQASCCCSCLISCHTVLSTREPRVAGMHVQVAATKQKLTFCVR